MRVPKGKGKGKIQIRKRASPAVNKKSATEEKALVPAAPDKNYFGGHRIQPGQVLNPAGRPPALKCIPDILRRIGDDPIPEVFYNQLKIINPKLNIQPKNNNMRFGMLLRVYYDAIRGDKDARNFIAERTEGKVGERGLAEGKGEIMEAIDKMLDTPLLEEKI